MAHNVELVARIRELLDGKSGFSEASMLGGTVILYKGNIVCGSLSEDLMLRLSPELAEKTAAIPEVSPAMVGGKPIEGMVYVSKKAVKSNADLSRWVNIALKYAATLSPKVKG